MRFISRRVLVWTANADKVTSNFKISHRMEFNLDLVNRLESSGQPYCWNELITLSTKYRDLTTQAQLALTVRKQLIAIFSLFSVAYIRVTIIIYFNFSLLSAEDQITLVVFYHSRYSGTFPILFESASGGVLIILKCTFQPYIGYIGYIILIIQVLHAYFKGIADCCGIREI